MELSKIPGIKDLEVQGRRVLVRVDFDTPLVDGDVADDTRIRAALPTINYLLENDARVVLMSHLGHPDGQPDPAFSMEPVARRLAKLLECGEVYLTDSCVGDGARSVINGLREGQVAILENLRFHAGELRNDDKLSKELASFADVYINDAFGTTHRAHASTKGVTNHVRVKAAGFLLQKEIQCLGRLLGDVDRPYVAILGGAKISDKLEIFKTLLDRVNTIIIGGAIANTFLAAKGGKPGASMVETDKLPLARDLMARAENKGVRLVLPSDAVTAADPGDTLTTTAPAGDIPNGMRALDIGPASAAVFKEIIGKAGTILWNGPMGMFENPAFSAGTFAIARAVAGCSAFSVIGGGDSVAAVRQSGLEKGFDHVSTGGDATLQMLEGKVLPGIVALIAG